MKKYEIILGPSGELILNSTITNVGMGRVILNDTKLAQGIYYYTLYVDGNVIDTKKMEVLKN